MGQGFGRKQKRRKTLEQTKDPLLQLNAIIDWEQFRPCWTSIAPVRGPGQPGRKPIDRMLLFKLLILQQMYNISDEQLEYQVHDRVSLAYRLCRLKTMVFDRPSAIAPNYAKATPK
jgi:hypothetical protein